MALPDLSIAGAAAGQPVSDAGSVSPFAGVTVATTASTTPYATASVALSSTANGALSHLGVGTLSADGATYTVSGSPALVQAALRGLVFTPVAHEVVMRAGGRRTCLRALNKAGRTEMVKGRPGGGAALRPKLRVAAATAALLCPWPAPAGELMARRAPAAHVAVESPAPDLPADPALDLDRATRGGDVAAPPPAHRWAERA